LTCRARKMNFCRRALRSKWRNLQGKSTAKGDSSTVSLPEVEGRKDLARLVGVRCIHTHPNGEGMVSLVDLNSLVKMRLDAMVAVGVKDGRITEIYAALPVRDENGNLGKTTV